MNHKSLIQTIGDVVLVWVKYMVKYIHICIMFLMHDKLKELRNHIRKLFFVSATKIGENTTNILNCYFSS